MDRFICTNQNLIEFLLSAVVNLMPHTGGPCPHQSQVVSDQRKSLSYVCLTPHGWNYNVNIDGHFFLVIAPNLGNDNFISQKV